MVLDLYQVFKDCKAENEEHRQIPIGCLGTIEALLIRKYLNLMEDN